MTDLVEGMQKHAEVIWDEDEFWKCENDYDIIHLHWPEYLSYEMWTQLGNTTPIPEDLMQRLISSLEHWKKNSTIVYTRHVQYPHRRNDKVFLDLYRLVTSYCNTVIHFANFSIQQFKEFYPDHKKIRHVVIPHHNYASLPNTISPAEARKFLGIDSEAGVMLVFGKVNEGEKEIIKKAFSYVPGNNKVLLAPGWSVKRRKIAYIRLREWIWKLEKWWVKQNKTIRIDKGFIEEDMAQYYLNAADFLFIPRLYELNSGNITLGCTFGLIVVGKNDADIGEILKETGNPTFQVGNDASLKEAIKQALILKSSNHGEKNRKIALEEWGIERIAKLYVEEMEFSIRLKKGK